MRSEPTYTQVEEAQNEQEYRGKLRELQAVDDLVRKVLSALTDTGQLQNTYVFFFTDNGYLFGEHRLQKKNLPYDEACRTPFIARGPSVLKLGFESNALVSQLDVTPTLCAKGRRLDGGYGRQEPAAHLGRGRARVVAQVPDDRERREGLVLPEDADAWVH